MKTYSVTVPFKKLPWLSDPQVKAENKKEAIAKMVRFIAVNHPGEPHKRIKAKEVL